MNYDNHRPLDAPGVKPSFQAHLDHLDERFGQTHNPRHRGKVKIIIIINFVLSNLSFS